MKRLVQPPSLMRLLCGSVLAYWLAGFINPAFLIIAVLIVFFIPIFLTDYSYLDADADDPSNSQDRHAPGSVHTSSAAAKQSNPENRISTTSRLLKEAEPHVDKTEKDTKNAKKPKTPNKH